MNQNIFTLKQQEAIAKAIKGFFELHAMDANPREHAKDCANEILATLVAEADLGAIPQIIQSHGNYTQWLTKFLDEIGRNDILQAVGIEAPEVSPSPMASPTAKAA